MIVVARRIWLRYLDRRWDAQLRELVLALAAVRRSGPRERHAAQMRAHRLVVGLRRLDAARERAKR